MSASSQATEFSLSCLRFGNLPASSRPRIDAHHRASHQGHGDYLLVLAARAVPTPVDLESFDCYGLPCRVAEFFPQGDSVTNKPCYDSALASLGPESPPSSS